MADLTVVASNVCIYWETSAVNPQLAVADIPGRCIASNYFSKTLITCYNDGNCNGSGTCRNCAAYSVGGGIISHKDTSHIYGTVFLQEWNNELKQYVNVRQLSADEASSESSFLNSLTYYQTTVSANISGEQIPMNLLVYNLRARFHRCCNWRAASFSFKKTRSGVLYAKYYSALSATEVAYLYTNNEGVYVNAVTLGASCSVVEALPWRTPFTTENPTAYGCNGCKPECPYYTGPKWTYCVDSKMEMGDKITAQQILELRFYSTDWTKFSDPEAEYRKRFKDPEIHAWSGKFEFGGTSAENVNDNPMVERVYISDFTGQFC